MESTLARMRRCRLTWTCFKTVVQTLDVLRRLLKSCFLSLFSFDNVSGGQSKVICFNISFPYHILPHFKTRHLLLAAFILTSRWSRSNRRPRDAPPATRALLHRPSLRIATSRHPPPLPRMRGTDVQWRTNQTCRWTTRTDRRLLPSAPPHGGSPGGEPPWPAALCPASPTNMRVRRLLLVHRDISKRCICIFIDIKNLLVHLCVVALCRNINTSLSDQERLDKLIEASMKVSVHNYCVL